MLLDVILILRLWSGGNLTLENKIKALEDKVKNRRTETWERIKTNDPALAIFLTDINKNFGKPSKLKIKFVNGEVLDIV